MKSFTPRVGGAVLYLGKICRIDALVGLNHCVLRSGVPGIEPATVDVGELSPVPGSARDTEVMHEDLSEVPERLLGHARRRLEIIRPLLDTHSRKAVEQVAKESGLSYWTLHRAIKAYRRTGLLAVLVPGFERRGGPRKTRLSKEQEDILDGVIVKFYLAENRPDITETHKEVVSVCAGKGVAAPSLSTVRNRIRAECLRVTTRARKGKKALKKLNPVLGSMPGAERPWMVVLIDHTVVDVIIVDRVTRLPIGRAHITVALDAATRVVVGFHVSLDRPSELSVGTCLTNSMLPKEAWLARLGVPGDWPVWGQPRKIQVDNAMEFRSHTLRRGCKELGIDIEWRRAGSPEDGGRIERFMRTLMHKLHILPGTTFSNPRERGEYKSVKRAAMTLDELEQYIAEWIVGDYHLKPHGGLDEKTPLQAWEEGLLNHGGLPGVALPVRHLDADALRLAFLPGRECTVQRDGISMHKMLYQDNRLRRWIGVKEPGSETKGKRFLARLDPRDISRLWFYDPELKKHIPVRYSDLTHPTISLWEWKEAGKITRTQGLKDANEAQRFATRDRMKAIAAGSVKLTKKARRDNERDERRREAALKLPSMTEDVEPKTAAPTPVPPAGIPRFKPFRVIEN